MNLGVTSNVIAEIIDTHYTIRQVPLLFMGESYQTHQDLINLIIRSLNQRRIIQLDSTIFDYSSWSYAVFIFQHYESLKNFIPQMESTKFDLFGYYTFVINTVTDSQIFDTFNTFWKLKIIRTVLVVVNDDHPDLYFYTPYSRSSCGSPTIHHTRDPSTAQLFMQRLNNFYNCSLRLGTFQTPPFVRINSAEPNRSATVSGFEGDLVTTLSGQLNFQLNVVTPPDNGEWGEARPQNSTGLMGILQDGTADFGIGCLGIIPQRNEILQPGRPHYTSRILFAVPEGRPFTAFEKLFRPFKAVVWFTSAAIMSAFTVLVLILKFTSNTVRDFIYGNDNRTAFLNFFNVYFTGVLPRLPQRNFARTLLILWIIHCFIVRSLYQGSLFKYLQAESNQKAVETISEIEHSNLYYYIFKMSERFFQNNPRVLRRVHHLTPGNDTINVQMDALATGKLRDGVLLVTLEHLAYHNTYHLDRGFVRCTRDAVSSYPMVIYYSKRTFLVRVLNRAIGNIETAGLMNYWIRRYGNYHFFPKALDLGEPQALRNEHLAGCYECVGVLLAIGCGIFVLEVVSINRRNLDGQDKTVFLSQQM
ncbi:uncharacterized protein LOC115256781 [Aedes albopictus]|uniref:Ionotropic glutamate receptor L-glutamate and glycine-binding domain-containing protein n=1 Tax=Aedes albopictus TaxID=7160 RepID=A0ABM1XW50_AEDAL